MISFEHLHVYHVMVVIILRPCPVEHCQVEFQEVFPQEFLYYVILFCHLVNIWTTLKFASFAYELPILWNN